jgi:hypothetical protein
VVPLLHRLSNERGGEAVLWRRSGCLAGALLEEPGRYDSLETRERHLAKIKAMEFAPDAIPSKAEMVRSAQEHIAQKNRHLREFNARQAKRA